MSVIRRRLMFYLLALSAVLLGLAVFVRWVEPRMAFFPFPGEAETPRDFGVPFEALTLATTDGERLRAWKLTPPAPQAARARIVYFHGNGGNLSNWSPILAGVSRFATYRFPAGEYLNQANAPVLMLHGDRDRVIPFALGRELFEQVTAAKEFVTIRGGDHNDAAAPDPKSYWAAIDRFILTLPRRQP